MSLLVQPRGPYARRAAAIFPRVFTAAQATSLDHALTVAALKPEPLRSLLQLAMAAFHRAEERFTGVRRGLEYFSEPPAGLDIEQLRAVVVDGDRCAARRLAELEWRALKPLRRGGIRVRRRAERRHRAALPAAEKGGDDAIS